MFVGYFFLSLQWTSWLLRCCSNWKNSMEMESKWSTHLQPMQLWPWVKWLRISVKECPIFLQSTRKQMLGHAMVSFEVKFQSLYRANRTYTPWMNIAMESLVNYLGKKFLERIFNIWCLYFLFFQSIFLFYDVNCLLMTRTIFQVTMFVFVVAYKNTTKSTVCLKLISFHLFFHFRHFYF